MDGTSSDPAELLKEFYALQSTCITPLSGYGDLNFLVQTEEFRSQIGGKFVLKIVNVLDTRRTGLTQSIMSVLRRLPDMMELRISRPVICLNGDLVGQVQIGGILRNLVLLSFVPGLDYKGLRFEQNSFLNLCEKIGKCAGNLLTELCCIESADLAPILQRKDDEYMIQNIHLGRKKLRIIEDENVRAICSEIMDFFEDLTQNYDGLREGLIHNDLCVGNLMFENNSYGEYDVVGVIDFSDMTYSFHVFEVAIPIASAMYQTHDLKEIASCDAAKAVFKGFESSFSLTKPEKQFLYYAILARFVSLRVIGGYDVLNSAQTAAHEEHTSESLELFITKMWEDGKEKWDKIF